MKVLTIVLGLWLSGSAASAFCVNVEAYSDFENRRIEIPSMTFLTLLTVRRGESGKYNIAGYPDLPKGGIDGRHLCGLFALERFGTRWPDPPEVGVPASMTALLLRGRIDYASAYPEAFPIAQARGQFLHFKRQVYWVGVLPEGMERPDSAELREAWAAEHSNCENSSFIYDKRTVLIPVC